MQYIKWKQIKKVINQYGELPIKMKLLIKALGLSIILFACNGKPVQYPDTNVAEIINGINWNGNFDDVEKTLKEKFKLEFGASKFNETGAAVAYEFEGGKLFGKNTESWVAGFLHDKLNAIIIKFAGGENAGDLYTEICGKLDSSLGKSKMELEKSKFWTYSTNNGQNVFNVICNIAPNTNDVLVVIKRNL